MHRFLSDGPFSAGALLLLDSTQAHHIAKVLRMEPGQTIGLVDGRGLLAQAVLTEVRAKQVRVRVESIARGENRSRVRLCFGISKGQALDFLFHRATELGVESFQPLQTEFSSPPKNWNSERWGSVVAEVCKQCEELFFPPVLAPLSLENWLASRESGRTLVVCDENARERRLHSLSGAVDLVVGAEGGLSRSEVELLQSGGAKFLGLGSNRLRAETAALVATSLVKNALGEI